MQQHSVVDDMMIVVFTFMHHGTNVMDLIITQMKIINSAVTLEFTLNNMRQVRQTKVP